MESAADAELRCHSREPTVLGLLATMRPGPNSEAELTRHSREVCGLRTLTHGGPPMTGPTEGGAAYGALPHQSWGGAQGASYAQRTRAAVTRGASTPWGRRGVSAPWAPRKRWPHWTHSGAA